MLRLEAGSRCYFVLCDAVPWFLCDLPLWF
jgi:hypothetical protein